MNKLNNEKTCVNTLNKIGIFAGSLLVTASAIYFYSPVFKSNAAQDLDSSKVDVTITTVASLALDTNNLAISVVPTDAGSFTSSPITATVSTNSTTGYELYFSSEDNATNMTHFDSSVSSVIASDFNGTVTSSTMAKNKWGYSLNNTDFSKIPTLADHVKLKDLDHYPAAAEKDTTVYIGTKISSDLPSGRYSKNVKFSVLAHNLDPNILDISNMQEMTSSICDATATGVTTELEDTRDGNKYRVTKLNDGRCWMTQNLRIVDIEISSDDSDIPSGETYTIPNSSYASPRFRAAAESAYVDVENDEYGGYYSFNVVTAGWGSNISNPANEDSPKSICAKGWRLPTGAEFTTLNNTYGTSMTALKAAPQSFALAGRIDRDTQDIFIGVGTQAAYYSSTTSTTSSRVITLSFPESNRDWPYVEPHDAYQGYSVRCIAK